MKVLSWFVVCLMSAAVAAAQPAAQADGEGGAPFPAGEVQKLLDGFAVVQAQEFLGMSDAQFAPFLPKLRALQEVRRRNEQERMRLLQDLRRMTNGRAANAGDTELRERLRALRELNERSVADIARAYDAIDQTLDLRQQARFRIFEQELERRKLQLLMRARQANPNRPNRQGRNP
jgi:hypothetical protein